MYVGWKLLTLSLMAMTSGRDEIYNHMEYMEGNIQTGYIPSPGSGVTIGMGIDLQFQSRAGLKAKNIPNAIITKLEPYFGKNKTQVDAAGLNPKDLKLTKDELLILNAPFIEAARKIAMEYGQNMSDKGKACLSSLSHWAGSLSNTKYAAKLARKQKDGSILNYIWNAIKDKHATDKQLLQALRETYATYLTPSFHRRTIEREINYLSKQSIFQHSTKL